MTEQPRRRGRPPLPDGPKPKRNIRVGPEWDEAVAIAKARGETITDVVTAAVRRYVARHRR